MIDRARPAQSLGQLRRVVGERPSPAVDAPADGAVLTEVDGCFATLWPRSDLHGLDPATRWVRVGHEGDAVYLGWHVWASREGGTYPVVRLQPTAEGDVRIAELGSHSLGEAVSLLSPRPAVPAPMSPPERRSLRLEVAREATALVVGMGVLVGTAALLSRAVVAALGAG